MPSARPHKARAKPAADARPARVAAKPAPDVAEQLSGGSHGEVDELRTRRFEAPRGSAAEVREVEGIDERIAPAQAAGAGNGETPSRRSKRPPEPPR